MTDPAADPGLLTEGTLRLSLTVPGLTAGLTALFVSGAHWGHPGGVFGLWIDPRGALVLRHRTAQGAAEWHGPAEFCGAGDRVRIAVQVWIGLGQLRIAAENGTTGATLSARADCIGPVPLQGAAHDLGTAAPLIETASLPLTPRGLNGVSADTALPTPQGPRPAGTLRAGDLLQTPDGPVLIEGVAQEPLTATQRQEAVRIAPPYFGLRAPLVVLPDQRLRLSSVEVEALTGLPAVLGAARDMGLSRAVTPDWGGTDAMVSLRVADSVLLPIGSLELALFATVPPGAALPAPLATPWARAAETRAIVDELARRKGIRLGHSATAQPPLADAG